MLNESYPCWVYHSAQPLQFELCTDERMWFKYRRQKWHKLRIDVISKRLHMHIESMGVSINEVVALCRAFGAPLADMEVHLLFSGGGPRKLYALDALEALAHVLAIPVIYLFTEGINIPPNIFKEGFRVTKKAVFRPPGGSRPKTLPPDTTRSTHSVDEISVPGEELQVFHILYALTDSAAYHRVHVFAKTYAHAEAFFLQTVPTAEIKEVSSQPVVPGLLIYNY